MRKQDIARIRNPADLDRRFNFGKSKQDIKQSQEDIRVNTQDIEKNSKDIKANEEQILQNTFDIAQNKKDIEQNIINIEENTKNIDNNTTLIEQNQKNIEANKNDIKLNTNARHEHDNKTVLDKITEENYKKILENEHIHENKDVLDKIEGVEIFDLEEIKNENMSNLVGNCISKNKRVVMNVSADIEILAETETILFNLPIILSKSIKFLIYSGLEIGLAELGIDGSIKVVFNNDVSNIFFNLIFDY